MEIFGNFGKVVKVEIQNVAAGSQKMLGMVEFEKRQEAEKAVDYMDNGQLDGLNVVVKLENYKERKSPENRKREHNRRDGDRDRERERERDRERERERKER